ncbi:MAG: adenylate kinase [Gemmatimonadota bacterium]|nr:adenylate kinase [Gemmatimonadota bacterium]
MDIVLLGPPGSGKGTQGALLADRIGIPRVSTGDLLRSAVSRGTALGRRAQSCMDQGLLVPDDVIIGLIEEVLGLAEAANGVMMDGFPRTLAQAEAVDRALEAQGRRVDHVLNIDVPDRELFRRLSGRAREQGRSDDTPEAIRKRLAVYGEQTAPLVQYYGDRGVRREVRGTGNIDTIAARIAAVLGI